MPTPAALLLTGLVAALHVAFMALEMVFWTKPLGRRVFRQTEEAARSSARLALNQGLYNGFLVAGLAWAIATNRLDLAIFFLGAVIVAGVFGALTVSPRIFLVQALPAILALAAWLERW